MTEDQKDEILEAPLETEVVDETDAGRIKPRKIKSVKREATLRIVKYAGEGTSIAYDNEKVIFVRYVLPGELVRVNIYKESKDYAMGEPLEILEPSADRVNPPCQYFGLCGGCDYQILPYEKQLEIKTQMVLETFLRIGKMALSGLTGVLKSPQPLYYRNTETFKVNPRRNLIGFFRKDTKFIVDLKECKLAMPAINEAMQSLRENSIFPEHNFKVRTTNDNDTVVHWVFSDKYQDRHVYETIEAAGKKIKFKISKDSFFQVNNAVIPFWLEKIISFLDKDGHERIFDLYSGIGLITLFVSYFARETVGVEIAKSSVQDAIHNKEINKIDTNIQFIQAPVEDKLPELGYADVMIIDPPRKGMEPSCIDVLLKMTPKKIIYSSCKPSTMARDINLLSSKYELKELHLVDMFPQTHHVEMLALLVRKE